MILASPPSWGGNASRERFERLVRPITGRWLVAAKQQAAMTNQRPFKGSRDNLTVSGWKVTAMWWFENEEVESVEKILKDLIINTPLRWIILLACRVWIFTHSSWNIVTLGKWKLQQEIRPHSQGSGVVDLIYKLTSNSGCRKSTNISCFKTASMDNMYSQRKIMSLLDLAGNIRWVLADTTW